MKAIKRPSGDQHGLLSIAGSVVNRSGVPFANELDVNVAVVAFLSPSHTKAICFPSGEKAGSDLWPEKLVKGTIFKAVAGDFEARPINLYSPKAAAISASPIAIETITTPFL